MATKKSKKAKVLSKSKNQKRSYTGLKKYVVVGVLAIAVIGIAVFWAAWNKASINVYDPSIDVINLPETGDVSYYTNCVIDKRGGIGIYPDRATIKCDYLGPKTDGYDFETSDIYLKCTVNKVIEMNVCTDGKAK